MRLILLTSIIFSLISCSEDITLNDVKNALNSDGIGATEHRIIVTSQSYNGNLGGLSGADDKCNQEAQLQGLKRNYKAILSATGTNVKDRLNDHGGAVFVFDGSGNKIQYTDNLSQLWNLSADPNTAAGGSALYALTPTDEVWSGTDTVGNALGDACTNWTSSAASGHSARYGDLTEEIGAAILSNGAFTDCSGSHAILCISQ